MPCRNFEDVVDRQMRTLDRWAKGLKVGALAGAAAVAWWIFG